MKKPATRMKIVLSKFTFENGQKRACLSEVKEKIDQRKFNNGLIFMNAKMYGHIRMWDRDQLDLITDKEKIKQGILAETFDKNFEIRVTGNAEDNLFGVIGHY